MKLSDRQINAALSKFYVANDGGPNDGYKIASLRRYVDRVFWNLNAVADALHPVRGRIDIDELDRAFDALVNDDYDRKHTGMGWTDIEGSIADVLKAVADQRKGDT